MTRLDAHRCPGFARRGRARRAALLVTGALAVLFSGAPREACAQPDSQKLACIQAHAEAQRSINASRLLDAQARLEICSAAFCPPAIQPECAALLDQVHRSLPRLTVLARDSDGRVLADISLFLDGSLVEASRRSSSIPLDPGTHALRVEVPGRAPVERLLQLQAGEGERMFVLEFPPPAPPASARPPSSAPIRSPERRDSVPTHLAPAAAPYAYGLLALGGVAAGSFTYFAISGRSRQTNLENGCAPFCTSADVSRMHRDYLVADISLGVAVASVIGSLLVVATQRHAGGAPSPSVSLSPRGLSISGRF